MTSNIKPKTPAKEAPTEPFKRAVGVCCARSPARVILRLPSPPSARGLPPTRCGCRSRRGGSMSGSRHRARPCRIRSRCGSPVTIRPCIASSCPAASRRARSLKPSNRLASRRSARGAWAAWKNLAAMLDDRFHRGKYDEITDRADAPIEDARRHDRARTADRRTPPPTARKLVELWRPLIEERAGRNLDRLERVLDDQRRFGDVRARSARLPRYGRGPLEAESDEEEGEEGDEQATGARNRPSGRRGGRSRRQRAHEPRRGRELDR